MQRKLQSFATIVLVLVLSACSLLPDLVDETKGWSAPKLYSEAKDEMGSGNYDKAIKYYEKLESRYPFGTYAQQAQMEIAYAYYRQGEQAQALAAVERFIKLHPNHSHVDYMYYLRGLINFNDKLSMFHFISRQDPTERDPKAAREAFDSFKELAERFPDSPYTKDAIARMRYLVNAIAQYEVHVANYYLRRGAYVAAANRAQTAVKEYPDTPAAEEGLFIMMRAYDALGMKELRDDAESVLKKNYPNSDFFRGGRAKKDPWWKLW
ncbi:MAG: outer membrane protein assembly factor BamD [Proteobacteria bacterium]|nr:outer membrane protein assembly factor BamD [Pseudomonadota bacterium]